MRVEAGTPIISSFNTLLVVLLGKSKKWVWGLDFSFITVIKFYSSIQLFTQQLKTQHTKDVALVHSTSWPFSCQVFCSKMRLGKSHFLPGHLRYMIYNTKEWVLASVTLGPRLSRWYDSVKLISKDWCFTKIPDPIAVHATCLLHSASGNYGHWCVI